MQTKSLIILLFFAASETQTAPISRKIEAFGSTFPSKTVDDFNDFLPTHSAALAAIAALDLDLDQHNRKEDDLFHDDSPQILDILEPFLVSYVEKKLDVKVKVISKYDTFHQISHFYLQQFLGEIPIVNGLAAIHLDHATKKIAYFTHSLALSPERDLAASPKLPKLLMVENDHQDDSNLLDYALNKDILSQPLAFEAFISYLGYDEYDNALFHSAPMSIKYMRTINQGLRLVWDIELDLDTNWFNALIDAKTGKVLQLHDWVSHSTFEVFPIGFNDPRDGPRKLVVDPEHPLASPIGWTSFKANNGKISHNTDTQGNNVFAQSNPNGRNEWRKNHRPNSTNDIFAPVLDLSKDPKSYIDAAIVNLFYWNNIIHDLFYVYGFTEPAGNFQGNNFGRGGRSGDSVIANAQDGSGTNNANFATPPDGTPGRMRMYIWTQTKPARDGDLEAGIVVHEYAHGISTRLTGGPANSGCLGWGEAGGMGEGWGDWFATILRMNANTTRDFDFGMGDYSAGGRGIRKYVYSTNNVTNPSTYAFVRLPGYWGVHAKGEVWAEILYEFFWDLVDAHGWQDDYFDVPLKKFRVVGEDGQEMEYLAGVEYPLAGNKLALRLVVDGLKLQPCMPSFVDARDAILQADKMGTRGRNQCLIWSSFARRGLGVKAVSGGREDFTVPSNCNEDEDE